MSGSQADASAVAEGRLSEGSRSSHTSPRTPDGPSETRMRRSPIFSIGQVFQKSRPVSSWTFSSRVSAARASARRGPAGGGGGGGLGAVFFLAARPGGGAGRPPVGRGEGGCWGG